jgi:8-oxo-dGTP pyrophosphatase MutT (NUDIX family)
MSEPEAAIAIVHARNLEEAVLLMRRAEREGDSWSGQWSFPGGRRAPHDIDLLRTALRELEEECGIRLGTTNLETAMPPRLARRAAGPYLLVAPFVLRIDCQQATVLDRGEAAEAVWVPLDDLRNPARHCLRSVPGRPPEMRYPAIELNCVPLWGFTYRLLTDWLGIFPQEQPAEQAGLAVANAILEFLQSQGMTLQQRWRQLIISDDTAGPRAAQEATLGGTFPAAAVLEHFCRPGQYIHSVNMLEVRSDRVRLVGAAFEEYLLRAAQSAA